MECFHDLELIGNHIEKLKITLEPFIYSNVWIHLDKSFSDWKQDLMAGPLYLDDIIREYTALLNSPLDYFTI